MTIRNLEALFDPRSVALIGASPRPGSLGQLLARNMQRAGFRGRIDFVHPRAEEVEGQVSYPDVASLPEAPDLAVIATPPDAVAGIIGELGARGTRGAVVITAGFGEGGSAEGMARRQAILDAARPHLLRIVGPNGVGLVIPRIGLDASFVHLPVQDGGLAFVSQSGAVIVGVVDWAQPRGVGFSHLVSMGDMADVDFGDMLDYLARDPQTTAILLYVEAVTNARKFMSAARAAARVKPVIVMKAGRHEEGARAAASHTGALAGSDAVYDTAFARAGMLRVTTLRELFEAAELLADNVEPHGDRLAIVTNGGGFGVLATDSLIDEGGRLAELTPRTVEALDRVLPPTWSRANPVDIIGDAPGERYVETIERVLEDPEVDAVLVMNCPTAVASSYDAAQAVAEALDAAAGPTSVPVIAAWIGDSVEALKARRLLDDHGLAVFETPDEAVGAFMHRVRYSRARAQLLETPPALAGEERPDRESALAVVEDALSAGREWLSEAEAKRVLAAYLIPTVETAVVRDLDQLTAEADRLGYPVAVKIVSPQITHKSDVGGVALDLGSAEAARDAAERMFERVRAAVPRATIEGFTVQPMIERPRAHELILGMTEDAQFGPVLLFGHGGTATEVIADRSLALPPLSLTLAHRMIEETRVARLLAGYRDRPPADVAAIAEILVRLSDLVVDRPEIVELDINPLLADDRGVLALDARVRLTAGPRTPLAVRPYPHHLARPIVVAGRPMTLRPIRPEDELVVREAVPELDPETARPRFLAPVAELSHETAARLTQIDYDRELLLAVIEGRRLIGLGRLGADPDGIRADLELSALGDETREDTLDALLDSLIGEAATRGIGVLSVHLWAGGLNSERYRQRGFAPPATRGGDEEWTLAVQAEPHLAPGRRPASALRLRGGGRLQRQPHLETRAARFGVAHLDRPAVALNDLAHDRQPEAGATGVTPPAGIEACEPLEDPLPLRLRDPGSVVRHRQRHEPARAILAQFEGDPLRRVTCRVLEQVPHHAREQLRVGDELRSGHPERVHRHRPPGAQSLRLPEHHVIQVHRHRSHRRAGVSACQHQQVPGEPLEAQRLLEHRSFRLQRRGLLRPRQVHLDLRADVRQRAPQLVRGIRDELLLPRLRLVEAAEHRVHRLREPSNLVPRLRLRHAAMQLARGDPFHLRAYRLHRRQRPADEVPGHCRDDPHEERTTHDEAAPQRRHALLDRLDAVADVERVHGVRALEPLTHHSKPILIVDHQRVGRARLAQPLGREPTIDRREPLHVRARRDHAAPLVDQLRERLVLPPRQLARQRALAKHRHEAGHLLLERRIEARSQLAFLYEQRRARAEQQRQRHQPGRPGGRPEAHRPGHRPPLIEGRAVHRATRRPPAGSLRRAPSRSGMPPPRDRASGAGGGCTPPRCSDRRRS